MESIEADDAFGADAESDTFEQRGDNALRKMTRHPRVRVSTPSPL
jgi:hypothetical protein